MRKLVGLSLAVAVLLGASAFGVERHPRVRRFLRKHPKVGEGIRDKYDRNDDGKLGPRERAKLGKDFHAKLKDKREERREKIVDKFDGDGDGKLTGDERAAAREALKKFHHAKHFLAWKKRHPALWKKILAKYDADGDGKLGEAERQALRQACAELRDKVLEKFDKDGDGKLSAAERAALLKALRRFRRHKHFCAWLKKHPGLRKKLLARFDADGDGALSEAERQALHEAFKDRRAAIRDKIKERRAGGAGAADAAGEPQDIGDF